MARSKKPESFLTPIIVSVWLIALIEIGFIVASGVRLGLLASASSRRFFNEIGMHANDLGRLFAVAYALLLFVWLETQNGRLKTVLFFTLNLTALALMPNRSAISRPFSPSIRASRNISRVLGLSWSRPCCTLFRRLRAANTSSCKGALSATASASRSNRSSIGARPMWRT